MMTGQQHTSNSSSSSRCSINITVSHRRRASARPPICLRSAGHRRAALLALALIVADSTLTPRVALDAARARPQAPTRDWLTRWLRHRHTRRQRPLRSVIAIVRRPCAPLTLAPPSTTATCSTTATNVCFSAEERPLLPASTAPTRQTLTILPAVPPSSPLALAVPCSPTLSSPAPS